MKGINESALQIRWLKYWSFSFSISLSNEYLGLISFRIDRFNLSLLYGPTLISLHDYWKNHSFDYKDLCGKVMSLLLMLSRTVIAFLSRSKYLLILWLQSLSTVIWGSRIIKSAPFPSICHEVMESDSMILVFWMLSFKPAFSLRYYPHQEVL